MQRFPGHSPSKYLQTLMLTATDSRRIDPLAAAQSFLRVESKRAYKQIKQLETLE
jgi:hypothetical protein